MLKSTNYIKNEKPILIKIIGLIAIFNLVLTAMLIVGIPILIVDILKMSDVLLGVSQGVLAMGGLCGGILTAVLSEKLKLSNSYYLLFLCSICVGVMAIPFLLDMTNMVCYVVMTATSFMIMGLATIFSVQMIATVQIETPPELVGKVIALMMSLAMSAQPIGQAIYGVAFDKFSNNAGAILISVMIVSVTISIVSRKIFRKIDM